MKPLSGDSVFVRALSVVRLGREAAVGLVQRSETLRQAPTATLRPRRWFEVFQATIP